MVEVTAAIKRKAEDNSAEPPFRILRTELAALPLEVLFRRVRRKNLPPNPTTMCDLKDVPKNYQRTLTGEKFLIFDSRPADGSEDEDDADEEEGAADEEAASAPAARQRPPQTLVFAT